MCVNSPTALSGSISDTLDELSIEILRFLQEEALSHFPAFSVSFGQLVPRICSDLSCAFASDGTVLYYHPELVRRLFQENLPLLRRSYLHVHLHCICLHMIQSVPARTEDWDAACDLSAELLADLLSSNRKELLNQLRQNDWLPPVQLLALLQEFPELRESARTCVLDDHRFWIRDLVSGSVDEKNYGSDVSCPGRGIGTASLKPDKLTQLEELQKRWQTQLPALQQELKTGNRGGKAGTLSEDAELIQRDSQDYRKFLRQFAVPGEETIVDMDSFDYIPYYYGLECYSKDIQNDRKQSVKIDSAISSDHKSDALHIPMRIPFLEPLEYTEVNRLDELAIAIDTSGSCSGKIVRRFLEETWSILRQRENFFAKMRLHLIQCDCMVQEHRIFTSVEEWEEALKEIKILGHGNTDFCPVFTYLEKLIAKKEIRHLRGLLYFTDGDGIFPTKPPAWDTAFVFLNQKTEKHAIPDWAIRLNLHLPEEF